ncbi:MAG TPA: hypothetical protein VGY66_01715, partial [Gemmataceae bacterium]|nr:hypothetical protein [Gemmataceae bacterium]
MPGIRILLDQNAPLGLRRLLSGHDVVTVARLGWSTIQNGDLFTRVGPEAAASPARDRLSNRNPTSAREA